MALAVRFALGESRRLGLQRQRRRAPVAIDAVRHQRMAGIDHLLHGRCAMALLAFHHEAPCEHEVVEDRLRIGPLAEEMVAAEEGVVAVARVRHHQGLRGHGVLFHEVRDARARVDDDLVGEALHAAPVRLLVADELLAVRPVRIADRQSRRGVGVEHLLRGDDLDLVGVRLEAVLRRDLRDRRVVALEQIEIPVAAVRNRAHCLSFRKSSRKTG